MWLQRPEWRFEEGVFKVEDTWGQNTCLLDGKDAGTSAPWPQWWLAGQPDGHLWVVFSGLTTHGNRLDFTNGWTD